MNHTEQRLADLAEQLESSVEAARTKGRFVPSWELPTEATLHGVAAQLERGVGSQRRLRVEIVLPMPTVTGELRPLTKAARTDADLWRAAFDEAEQCSR